MENINDELLPLNKDYEIEYLKERESLNMPENHFHDCYEIYYEMSGERHYFIKDRVFSIKKGDLVLIGPYDLHKTTYAGTPNYSRILVNFKKSFIQSFIENIHDMDLFYCFERKINVCSLTLSEQTSIENILFKMIEENAANSTGVSSTSKVYLLELLIFISRYTLKIKTPNAVYVNILHKKISEAAQYINTNYSEPFSLNSISQRFHISPYYFCRVFKEVTGFTFIEYLNNIRVKQSQKLLKETKLSITEIAYKVGFESNTHFGRVFKKIMHVSPLKYRNLI